MGIDVFSKDGPKGPYPVYKIKWILLDLPKAIVNEDNGDDRIDGIL